MSERQPTNAENDVPPRCVPLCGATRAYGKNVRWWHHEPPCPARVVPPADGDDCTCGHDHGVSTTACDRCYWCQQEARVLPPGARRDIGDRAVAMEDILPDDETRTIPPEVGSHAWFSDRASAGYFEDADTTTTTTTTEKENNA